MKASNPFTETRKPTPSEESVSSLEQINRRQMLNLLGAVRTALLGRSPDGSTRAIFAVVCADGSIVQEHTQQALDGLAPGGTVDAVLGHSWHGLDADNRKATPRVGVLLNYEPTRILYMSEPFANSIAALDLTDDGVVFHVASIRRIHSWALDGPVDLAPAEMETDAPDWASNPTLEEGADFYVANRGNNTIVRMRQDGTVVAIRFVLLAKGLPLSTARLNGIATTPDGNKVWVTVTGRLPGYGSKPGCIGCFG